MHEYSRILIEEYCFTRKTKKAEIRERNPELKEALIDLDDFLFNY